MPRVLPVAGRPVRLESQPDELEGVKLVSDIYLLVLAIYPIEKTA